MFYLNGIVSRPPNQTQTQPLQSSSAALTTHNQPSNDTISHRKHQPASPSPASLHPFVRPFIHIQIQKKTPRHKKTQCLSHIQVIAKKASSRSLISLLNLSNRLLPHRNTAILIITKLNNNIFLSHINNNTIKTTGSNNTVTNLHAVQHSLSSLLLLLLRTDHHKIHNSKQNYDPDNTKTRAKSASCRCR